MILPDFPQKLDALLQKKGILQKELAAMCKISDRHLSRVKRDMEHVVPDKILQAICTALDTPISYFWKDAVADAEYFPVPYRDAGGGMGGGYAVGSRRVNSYLSIRTDYLRHRTNNLDKLSFVHASGESMLPTIPADTSVLIDEGQTEPVNNKIFYIMLNGEYFIKRLEVNDGSITAIISDNGNARYIVTAQDTVEVLGRAILQIGDL